MPDRAIFEGVDTSAPYWLLNARLPSVLTDSELLPKLSDGLAAADIRIENGGIAGVDKPAERNGPAIDLRDGIVWPGIVDMHTHLDKGHIWPRQPNPDGTFSGALASVADDTAFNWSADDLRARAEFALRSAHAHGTVAIRTHIDSLPPQDAISWPVFEALRDEWRSRIELQMVSLVGIEAVRDDAVLARIADRVSASGGVLGAVTYMVPDVEDLIAKVFAAASARGLDLDFHADESLDADARSLELIADTALATGFAGRIVCGHCCSLSVQSEADVDRILGKVKNAGIGIVSLAMCNLYLQDRTAGRTPRRRGVTLVREMQARGIPVAIASDNTRDPFYAYGDLDGLEVFREAVRIGHLDHPADASPALITSAPADMTGLTDHGRIVPGAPADLILFDGRTLTELLSRPESARIVLRQGRPVERALPDYRDLDEILGVA